MNEFLARSADDDGSYIRRSTREGGTAGTDGECVKIQRPGYTVCIIRQYDMHYFSSVSF